MSTAPWTKIFISISSLLRFRVLRVYSRKLEAGIIVIGELREAENKLSLCPKVR